MSSYPMHHGHELAQMNNGATVCLTCASDNNATLLRQFCTRTWVHEEPEAVDTEMELDWRGADVREYNDLHDDTAVVDDVTNLAMGAGNASADALFAAAIEWHDSFVHGMVREGLPVVYSVSHTMELQNRLLDAAHAYALDIKNEAGVPE